MLTQCPARRRRFRLTGSLVSRKTWDRRGSLGRKTVTSFGFRQGWALSLVKARPLGAMGAEKVGRKGSDRGIDGTITFIDDNSGKAKRVLVQVKSGHVKSGDLRDLKGTLEREKADIWVFITLEPSTSEMEKEAVTAGFYHSPHWGSDYPKLQILTIEELLDGREVKMPQTVATTFKKAEKVKSDDKNQGGLFD